MIKLILVLFSILFFQVGFCQKNDSLIQDSLSKAFYDTHSLQVKQDTYNEIMSKYPENTTQNKSINYDELKRILSLNLLLKGDTAMFTQLVQSVKDKFKLSENFSNVSGHFMDDPKLLSTAKKLSETSLRLLSELAQNPEHNKPEEYTTSEWIKHLELKKSEYTDTYAYILFKQGYSEKAVELLKPIYEKKGPVIGLLAEHYSIILGETGKPKESIEIIRRVMSQGYISANLLNELKSDYTQINGSDKGYEDYLQNLRSSLKASNKRLLLKKMIEIPMAKITLKDFEGNSVSLSDYLGKIIVIDFWATWCGPCKASFVGMQQVVNKYKSNPNIVFLFIDTWENSDNYIGEAKKYMSESKYPFYVLFDKKNEQGKQTVAADAFKVNGIPSRFIVDRKGIIRFKEVGYSGVPSELSDTISQMIEILE